MGNADVDTPQSTVLRHDPVLGFSFVSEGSLFMDQIHVIDADGHVLENDKEIELYFESPYQGVKRSGVFSLFPSLDGWPRGFVRGLDKISTTPVEVWIDFIDKAKLDAAVLYPTSGLSFGLIQDPDWACVVARAY